MIVTLGPACHEVDDMIALLEAGMSCARIDLTVTLTGLAFSSVLLHSACCVHVDPELAGVHAHTQLELAAHEL